MLDLFLKRFLVRKSKVSAIKNSIVTDCSQELKEGIPSRLEVYVIPEVLQAVDNEKISILITSYKAAVIPSNNAIGARPCHCQTAKCTIVFSFNN